jgi:hypothetical protein
VQIVGRVGVGFARVDNFAIAETSIATGAFSFGSVFEGGFIVRAVGQFSPDPVAFEGTLPGAGQTANVTLRLQATSVITGTIVEPNGVTPAGADVIVRYKSASYKTTCASGDSGEETCTSIPQGIQSEIVTTDANGRFVVPLVNAGPFRRRRASGRAAPLFRGSVKPGGPGRVRVGEGPGQSRHQATRARAWRARRPDEHRTPPHDLARGRLGRRGVWRLACRRWRCVL